MLNCAVVGATGYTGAELVRILLRHPDVRIVALTTRQEEAIPLRKIIPELSKGNPLEIRKFSFPEIKKKADAVFLALPHTEAMEFAPRFCEAGKIVIDLSADFRLQDINEYEKWYGIKHTARRLLANSVYGLPELFREKIREAGLIANPGCYPTGAVLGIAPLLRDSLVEPSSIIVDAKSGVSGAGKKMTSTTQFCEVDENFSAYKVNRHPHIPEISQTLNQVSGQEVHLTFVPHLLPVNRGILSTIYLQKAARTKVAEIRKSFAAAYSNEPFVRLLPEGEFPDLRSVQGTNFCDIGFTSDPDGDEVIVITAIDNLLKGASGQAVQNLNLRAGFSETTGLLN